MGQMNRAIAREGDDRLKLDRFASTLVIAASVNIPLRQVSLAAYCFT